MLSLNAPIDRFVPFVSLQVGTSSVVYPAAMFAPQVAARGVPVAEFNMENTPATERFKHVSLTITSFFLNSSTSQWRLPVSDGPVCLQVPLPRTLRDHVTSRSGSPRERTDLTLQGCSGTDAVKDGFSVETRTRPTVWTKRNLVILICSVFKDEGWSEDMKIVCQ